MGPDYIKLQAYSFTRKGGLKGLGLLTLVVALSMILIRKVGNMISLISALDLFSAHLG